MNFFIIHIQSIDLSSFAKRLLPLRHYRSLCTRLCVVPNVLKVRKGKMWRDSEYIINNPNWSMVKVTKRWQIMRSKFSWYKVNGPYYVSITYYLHLGLRLVLTGQMDPSYWGQQIQIWQICKHVGQKEWVISKHDRLEYIWVSESMFPNLCVQRMCSEC